MNIIINDFSHSLIKKENTVNYIEYDVYRADSLIGHITKYGAEILYTARATNYNIIATGTTLRDTLEAMILKMFYSHSFKGDRLINTLGAWTEGAEVKVEYTKNNAIRYAKRVVRYNKDAGDLYIVIDNNNYFLHEFE